MKKNIVIIGGGVIGLTTAWVLIKNGYRVHLLEKEHEPGLVTSYANGGQLSYRYVSPLADHGIPLQGIKWMCKPDSPLNLRLRMSVSQWRWLLQFILVCNRKSNKINGGHLLRLSMFSQQVMKIWREEDRLDDFDWFRSGKLIIYRETDAFGKAAHNADQKFQQILDSSRCTALEPSLSHIECELKGGIYSPGDETADCQKFCQSLLNKLNLCSHFTLTTECDVQRFKKRNERIISVLTSKGQIEGDDFVVTAGNDSRTLLKQTGVSVPLYPLRGYSLTLPCPPDPGIVPAISVTDYGHKIVYARLGDRLRIAAMVDIGYADTDPRFRRLATLKRIVAQTFPALEGLDNAETWSGQRPSTPAGPPLIGRVDNTNLWVNIGHGSLGFTLAAGCAVVLGALIDNFASPISLEGLTW